MTNKETTVKADFFITIKSDFDFYEITGLLGVNPNRARTKDTFKIMEYARDSWKYETDYEVSDNINNQLSKTMALF